MFRTGTSDGISIALEDMRTLEGIDTCLTVLKSSNLNLLEDMRTLEGIDTCFICFMFIADFKLVRRYENS